MSLMFVACNEDYKPKPKAMFALDFPKPEYENIDLNCPYTFQKNTETKLQFAGNDSCIFNIVYPKMQGVIYITYEKVEDNLDKLLADAQQLPLKHTIKADEIFGDEYENPEHNSYGMLYTVTGNAASQAQFYLTDSTSNFLTGSIYFRHKPNYDSIYPASEYLKDDLRKLMESLKWKNNSLKN